MQEADKGEMNVGLRSWSQNWSQAKFCLRVAVTHGSQEHESVALVWVFHLSHYLPLSSGKGLRTLFFQRYFFPLQFENEMGGNLSHMYNLEHNCSETLAYIEVITLKMQNVHFWAPLLPCVLIAITSGNSGEGITLKPIANSSGARINVWCLFLFLSF